MSMQNGYPGFSSNWWTNIQREDEPAQYYGSPTGISIGQGSPRRQRYFSNAYDDIFKDYLGVTGSAQYEGREPMSFMEFLETDPWTKRYSSLPQQARGATGMAANPRTRFLYNF